LEGRNATFVRLDLITPTTKYYVSLLSFTVIKCYKVTDAITASTDRLVVI